MTVSWTFSSSITINGVDVSSAAIRYSISGNHSNAVVGGTVELNKRALDALVTVTAAMPVVIARNYVVTTDGTPANVSQTIFRGYTLVPTDSRARTTIQVQDKLMYLLSSEINKTYGTSTVPVDLSEIAYDIITSAGLTAIYNDTGATVQKSDKKSKGMTFSHTNSYSALKSLADALNWQFYYNPITDKVYFEPKGYQTANKPSLTNADWSGNPQWSADSSQMCNSVTVLPEPINMVGPTFYHTLTSELNCEAGAVLSLTVPRKPYKFQVAFTTPSEPNHSFVLVGRQMITQNPERRMDEDYAYIPDRDGPNLFIFQNGWYGGTRNTSAFHNFPAGTKFEVMYYYTGPVPQTYTDVASKAAYGLKAKTISRPDLSREDARQFAKAYVGWFKDPLEQAQIRLVHDPTKFVWLGSVADITDAANGKTETDMVVASFELNWPRKYDTFTFGQLQSLTSDYTTGLETRIKNLESSGMSRDYTQGQYTPLDPSGEEEEPGGGTPSSGGKVTVSSGVLNGPDGSPIHLKGVNDSASWCGFANARGGSYSPDTTTSCPVTNGHAAVDSSSAEAVATFFYRYGLALKTLGLNFVRMGAHSAWGLDALYTAWRADATQFDLVTKAMAQGLESAGVYFQLCCSGFAETPTSEGGDGYANRRLQTTMTTSGSHLSATGYLTDNILHKDSTSYNNFAAFCVHVGDLVGDFPHFVALELSNEPDNWRQCPVYWTAQYGDDYSTNGAVETAMKAWGSGLASKIRASRTKTWNITNGWTPLAGPPWHTRATVLPISNPGDLIRDLNTGMDIAGYHVYHFSPIFCDTYNSGNCDGTTCGQTNIHTAIKASCATAGMPVINDEWGRYCDSAQAYVSTIADTMTSVGVHWACIAPSSRPSIGSGTLPAGWDDLPVVVAPPPSSDDYKYTVTVSSGTYTARDAGGTTLTSGTSAHTVINAAINALTSGRTTKESILLQGTFALTSAILPANYTRIALDGTAYWSGTGDGYIAYASGKHDIEFIGGTWDGRRASRTGVYSAGDPMYFYNCTDLMFSNLYVHHSTYETIACEFCDRVSFLNCEISDGYWNGLLLAGCSDCLVDSCHIHDMEQGGCYFYCEDDETAQTLEDNTVTGCLVERTLTSGISFSPRGAEDTVTRGIIENNICVDCGTDGDHPAINVGFSTVKGQGTIVRNNNITCPAGLSGAGIEFGVDNGECTGNTISGTGEAGISCWGNGNTVTGNDVRNCGSQASYYYNIAINGNNNTVTGNTIGQTPNGSIYNSGTGNTTTPNTLVA